ncbi:MAG: class I SAM-dependent methyltransferase [Patescibacteria group bacterium]|nr:class I SAM-dependent methyltransferase [Patescibacteria group bacterium]
MFIRPKEIIEILTKNLFIKRDDIVIEFGCGGGYFTALLAERCQKVYAVDILEDHLKETQELIDLYDFKNVVFLQADVKNLPYEYNFFDVVFISQILFQNEGYDKILDSALRIAKDGGVIIILEPYKKLKFINGNPIHYEFIQTYFKIKNKKIIFQKFFGDYYLIVAQK